MPGMLQSPRNRVRLDVDNPIDSDGFDRFRRFKVRNPGLAGGRTRRRAARRREDRVVARVVREAVSR